MNDEELLAALRKSNDEREAKIRRGWFWIRASIGCFAIFICIIGIALYLDRFPWWLMTIALVFELGTFICLGNY